LPNILAINPVFFFSLSGPDPDAFSLGLDELFLVAVVLLVEALPTVLLPLLLDVFLDPNPCFRFL